MVLNDVKLCASSSGLALAILVLVAVLLQGPAQAKDNNREVASDPVYHEATGSYFQVVRFAEAGAPPNWANARAAAGRKSYKGRRGRLAKIDNPAVHQFIGQELPRRGNAFIGLRFVCSTRQLVWLDGSTHQNGFAPWSRVWYRAVDNCATSRVPFMPVMYTPQNRWTAQGPAKFLDYYIVEYPAVNEEQSLSAASD